jgi:hypothetical protein
VIWVLEFQARKPEKNAGRCWRDEGDVGFIWQVCRPKSPRMRGEAYFFLDFLLTRFLFFKVFACSSRKAGFGCVLFYQEKEQKQIGGTGIKTILDFNYQQKRNKSYQKILLNKLLEFCLIRITHADVNSIVEDNPVALNNFNPFKIYNEGTMHSHEFVRGKLLFD